MSGRWSVTTRLWKKRSGEDENPKKAERLIGCEESDDDGHNDDGTIRDASSIDFCLWPQGHTQPVDEAHSLQVLEIFNGQNENGLIEELLLVLSPDRFKLSWLSRCGH